MFDRSIRSLVQLSANASSMRALNLLAIWRTHGDEPDHGDMPFFASPILNRSIVLKHRLRRDEGGIFGTNRQVATKVILPLDPLDLKIGGRAFFVGQREWRRLLEEISPSETAGRAADEFLLELLDGLPSLDPFLMRENLREAGYFPAACYFDLTEADVRGMYAFARQEIQPLIGLSFDDMDALDAKTAKLANKILADANDADLDPLRETLGMDRSEFVDGLFCWKGFIYYKWRLSELLPLIGPVAAEIAGIQTHDMMGKEGRAYIASSRDLLSRTIRQVCGTVREALAVYDDAFMDLTANGDPRGFREFLLRAPELFRELGERLGAVHHIVSFWRFRFPTGRRPSVGVAELRDIFMDFETSLIPWTDRSWSPKAAALPALATRAPPKARLISAPADGPCASPSPGSASPPA